jgi:hypothetical protein
MLIGDPKKHRTCGSVVVTKPRQARPKRDRSLDKDSMYAMLRQAVIATGGKLTEASS